MARLLGVWRWRSGGYNALDMSALNGNLAFFSRMRKSSFTFDVSRRRSFTCLKKHILVKI